MATIKWLGPGNVTIEGVTGLKQTGDVFDVPDDQVERYTRRADVELVSSDQPTTTSKPTIDA